MGKARNFYRRTAGSIFQTIKLTGLVAIVAAGIAGGAKEAEGGIIDVTSFNDVVERASEHGGESRTYSCSNMTYNSLTPDKKIILFAYRDNNIGRLIGGLDNAYPMIPWTSGGFINKDDATTYWGLDIGQVLADVNGGFFAGVDLNSDGNVGTYNDVTGQLTFDTDEYFAPDKVQFTGFGAFPASGSETIDSINIIPEPATLGFLGVGALTSLLLRKRRKAEKIKRRAA